MCFSFDIYPVQRLYAALSRFPHLSLMYRGLLCGVDECWSSLDIHWPALHVAVSPLVLVRILPWTCHTPYSGEDATSFPCAVWLLIPMKTEIFLCLILFLEFNAVFRHLKMERDNFCTLFCVHVHMLMFLLFYVSCVLSSFHLCYYLAPIVQFMHTLHSVFRGQYQCHPPLLLVVMYF